MIGIKLEVVDAAEIGEEADEERQGKESWRASVEVDVSVELHGVNLFQVVISPVNIPTLQNTPSISSPSISRAQRVVVILCQPDHGSLCAISAASSNPATLQVSVRQKAVSCRIIDTDILWSRYFQPQVHVSILSSTSASVPFVLFLALRAAFSNLHVPVTKYVGYEGATSGDTIPDNSTGTGADDDMGAGFVGGDAGLTGAVRAPRGNTAAQKKARRGGKGKERQMKITGKGRAEYVAGPGDDWDLEDLGGGDEGEGELMERSVRLGLPACVTLNLVSRSI
jgi:hypothetical protein